MASLRSRLRRLPRESPLATLVLSILCVEAVGASGSVFTARGLDGWYETLRQPSILPPGWVFGLVWTLLFGLMGVAVWLVWRQAEESPTEVRLAAGIFAFHFVFNIGWSAVFFGMRRIGLGLLTIVVLWLLVLATVWSFSRVSRRAGVALLPYLLWVSFATYLNYRFWVLN
ncbi:TspO/MBR family protein [Halorutilales archaeon Cl-col2-1]